LTELIKAYQRVENHDEKERQTLQRIEGLLRHETCHEPAKTERPCDIYCGDFPK
jgi:hypothetical protein